MVWRRGSSPSRSRPDVTYGLAEFVAAEELDRHRGHWWGADPSDVLLVERADVGAVRDVARRTPSVPRAPGGRAPVPRRRLGHAASTPGWFAPDGGRTPVSWDHETYEYVSAGALERRRPASVAAGAPTPAGSGSGRWCSRLTRRWVPPGSCAGRVRPGVGRRRPGDAGLEWGDGRLVTVEVVADRYALCVDGGPVSPARVQVPGAGCSRPGTGAAGSRPHPRGSCEDRVLRVEPRRRPLGRRPAGSRLSGTRGGRRARRPGASPSSHADGPITTYEVLRAGAPSNLPVALAYLADEPPLQPVPRLARAPTTATPPVLLPRGWTAAEAPLPVILSPYGGPHHAAVVRSGRAFLTEQWIADQGFAVVVSDGRGTPGSPGWERAMRLDLAGPALDDQVTPPSRRCEGPPSAWTSTASASGAGPSAATSPRWRSSPARRSSRRPSPGRR